MADIFRRHGRPIVLFVFLANLPDADFILGWLTTGDPNTYHHGWTHSFAVAAGAAVVTAVAIRIFPGFAANVLWYFAAIGSHLLIDFFTGPALGMQQRAFGMPLLWPFSSAAFQAPITLIVGPKHHAVDHLLSLHNWVWGAYEMMIFGLLLLLTIKALAEHALARSAGPERQNLLVDDTTTEAVFLLPETADLHPTDQLPEWLTREQCLAAITFKRPREYFAACFGLARLADASGAEIPRGLQLLADGTVQLAEPGNIQMHFDASTQVCVIGSGKHRVAVNYSTGHH